MFLLILFGTLVLAALHVFRLEDRSVSRAGDIFLRYVLVGYCGLPMLAVSVGILAAPERMAEMLPVGPPSVVVAFFGWAYLGMSLISTLALRASGAFLVGPALCWSVYFAGATVVHLGAGGAHGGGSHGAVLMILATHGLIAVILIVALLMSGHLDGLRGEETAKAEA